MLRIAEAGRLWVESGEAAKLERTTLTQYQQHLDHHIVPMIGVVKLAQLTAPMVRELEDRLRATRSPAMVRKILGSLSAILADAQERGLVAQNVVRSLRARRRGKDRHADKRQKGRLKIGVDVPTPDEVRKIIAHLEGRWRPMLLTAIFTGLRIPCVTSTPPGASIGRLMAASSSPLNWCKRALVTLQSK